MKDLAYMVCVQRTEHPASISSAIPSRRTRCGAGVWITPASLDIATERGAAVVCTECARALGPSILEPPTEEQLREIDRELEGDQN
jgi:hypothetical protein